MPEGAPLPAGKLPGRTLDRLLKRYVRPDPTVLIGPEVGADAAAILVGNRVIVVKSDPITFPTPDVSAYLVDVNANDIACMGATPRWLLVTSLLPEGKTSVADVEEQFRSLSAASERLGIGLVGGHTEITVGLDRPIMVGMMIGETDPEQLLDLRRAEAGDAVLLCNEIAIEGTSILASEAPDALLSSVDPAVVERARLLASQPGISVVPAARALVESGATVRGMHDPTEGGLATALWELASVTSLDVTVDLAAIPILDESRELCRALGLDPLGLIASGALLCVVDSVSSGAAISHARSAGIAVTPIGVLSNPTALEPTARDIGGEAIRQFETDEIARFFSEID
jgi:hydrogenase maturation factor